MSAASHDTEQDLTRQVAQGAFASGAALRAASRAAGINDVERTISALSKRISQRAADKIDDRHSRHAARTEVYNAVRPVLETLAHHHTHLSMRAKQLTFMLVASAALGALAGWSLA